MHGVFRPLRDFAQQALDIQPTGVRKMFDMAGDDVISFGLGEPDFQPPEVAIEAFAQAMRDGHNKYTTTAGLPALRKIAESWDALEPGMDGRNVCMTMSGQCPVNVFSSLVVQGKCSLTRAIFSSLQSRCGISRR